MGNIYIPSISQISYAPETVFNETPTPGAQTLDFNLTPEEVSLPDVEAEITALYSVGSGSNPAILKAAARTLTGSLPMTLQNGRIMKYVLGASADVGTTPTVHTISTTDPGPPSFCMEAILNDGATDFIRYFSGCQITGCELAAVEEQFLTANCDIEAAFVTTSTTETPSVVTPLTVDPYVFCSGDFSFYGTTFARILDFSTSIKRAFKSRRYIQASNGCYPYEHTFGQRTIEGSFTVVASQDMAGYGNTIYEELMTQTSGGGTVELEFTRGVNDTFKITMANCAVKTAPHPINSAAEDLPCSVDIIAKDITVTVTDNTATY